VIAGDFIVGDFDRCEVAGMRSRIDCEPRKAVGMRRLSHGRPGCVLPDVDRRSLACLRVRVAEGSDHPTFRRGEEKRARRKWQSATADHHVYRSLVVSITSVAVAAGTGVRVAFSSRLLTGLRKSGT